MISPFEVLGLSEDATDAEVKAVWRDLVRRHHPDVGGDSRAFAVFQTAYKQIDTAEKRAALRGASSAAPAADPADPVEQIRVAQQLVTGKLEQVANATEAIGAAAKALSVLLKF